MRKLKNTLKRTLNIVLALSMLVSVLSMGVYAADENPVAVKVTLSETRTYVTIEFDREVTAATSNLTGRVKMSKNGGTPYSLGTGCEVTLSGKHMHISMRSAITTANNYFTIAADAFEGQTELIKTPVFSGEGPELLEKDSIVVDDHASLITIKFKDPFEGYPNDDSLKNGYISLARTGSTYNEIIPADDITVRGDEGEIEIYLGEALTGKRARFKIAAGKIQDKATGNLNLADIITPYIDATDSAETPEVDYVDISSDRYTATVYFTSRIKNAFAASGVSSSAAASLLKSHVWISRGSSGKYETLGGADTITVGSNYIRIKFDESLSSSRNYLKIDARSLTDYNGNIIDEEIETGNLTSGSTSATTKPSYASAFLTSNRRIVIYFTTNIKRNPDITSSELRSKISVSRNGGSYRELTSSDSVSISGTTLTISLGQPLTGTGNKIRIEANAIASETGSVLSSTVTTDSLSAGASEDVNDDDDDDNDVGNGASSGISNYNSGVKVSLSDDFYTVALKFAEPIYNNMGSLEELKEKIQLSRNGSFAALGADDYIRVNSEDNELVVILAKPVENYFAQMKVKSGALRDAENKTIITDITTCTLGEAGGDVRAYVNNSAVPDVVSASNSGKIYTATVSGTDALAEISKYKKAIDLLVKIPNDAESGTLNVSGEIAEHIRKYGGKIALSCGNATYYLPMSNVSTIASGDTISITVRSAASSETQSLASNSSKNSFSIECPAKSFNAKLVSATGVQNAIAHKSFAEKRFMVEGTKSTSTAFTVVRVEGSGMVVPVPSKTEIMGGSTYITADTLEDGAYAAISASHSFIDTPSWAIVPTNQLASRLILDNITGSKINPSEAITRAETVKIMSKTLGILGDMGGASSFFDVVSTDDYFNAVMSTVQHKIIAGYPDSTFKPSNRLTREEAMTVVARALRFMNGKSVSASPDISDAEADGILSRFADSKSVGAWAKVDIAECVQAGVVNGDNLGKLNPKANVTRAELIQLMYNILKNTGKVN